MGNYNIPKLTLSKKPYIQPNLYAQLKGIIIQLHFTEFHHNEEEEEEEEDTTNNYSNNNNNDDNENDVILYQTLMI